MWEVAVRASIVYSACKAFASSSSKKPAQKRPLAAPPSAAQGHREPGRAHSRCHCAAPALPAARPPPQEAPAASPGVEASVAVARRSSRPPLPLLPWAARCGASLQPGPYGATAARDASASAAVAPFFASQRQRWAARWSPSSQKVTQQWQRRFEERRLVVCVVCVVLCCVVCVVWCGVVCGAAWHAEKTSVCRFKTSPCVPAPRALCYHMRAWCRYTRGRFESTHGGFWDGHTGERGGKEGEGKGSPSVLLTMRRPT